MSESPKHTTGWEDNGLASLSRCGDVDVSSRDVILHADGYGFRVAPNVCPNCGAALKLVWDVRIEVVGKELG